MVETMVGTVGGGSCGGGSYGRDNGWWQLW